MKRYLIKYYFGTTSGWMRRQKTIFANNKTEAMKMANLHLTLDKFISIEEVHMKGRIISMGISEHSLWSVEHDLMSQGYTKLKSFPYHKDGKTYYNILYYGEKK